VIKAASWFVFGVVLGWSFAADHYGHIVRGDLGAGIMCRVHGLDGVRVGMYPHSSNYLCADLSGAIPEQQLFDEMKSRILGERNPQ